MNISKKVITAGLLAAFVGLAGTTGAQAERPFVVEGLAGAAVPTFDITDLADPGPVFGGAVGYFWDKFLFMGEFDFGTHGGADIEGSEGTYPDVDVLHYIAKVGYQVYQSSDEKLRIYVNLGAGALSFEADAEGAETNTYAAINAGAKLYYMFNEYVGVVVSPQGDIAFVDEDDGFTGSTAWVWPFTAGLAVTF
jgi:hypothetical protein